jgi:charged multivesicular body protein 7
MPVLRPSHARIVRCLLTSSTPLTPSPSTTTMTALSRPFSTTLKTQEGHGPSYDPPTGWLWGIAPGQKYEKEGWEGPAYWGLCGGLVLAVIGYGFKPDTS